MQNFEERLQAELDKLPYTKHLDDGQFNDGQLAGFEAGARWVLRMMTEEKKKDIIDAYWAGLNGPINYYSECEAFGDDKTKFGDGAEKYYNYLSFKLFGFSELFKT